VKPTADEFVVHRSLPRYGLAVLSVGIALGAALLLEDFHFRTPAALLLLFAVAIASWYGGRGPGVMAAILSTVTYYWYFVEPVRTIYINRSEIPYFVIFAAFAALLSRFGTFRQHAEADLRRTHDQLKIERPKLGSRIIALLYFAFSSCWILFTDRLVHRLGLSNTQLLKVSEAKGILFISLSTLLMYVLVEKALRQRHSLEAAYWQLVETAQEGVWSVDVEGKTVFANENMAAILGTSRGEMIGKSILPFVPQEKQDELLNRLLRRERGLQEHYEFAFLRAGGAQVWTLLRVSPLFSHGQHSGSLALVSDITERKRAEQELRRSEAWLAQTQAMTRTGSVVFNSRTGDALYLSDEWYRVFGYDPERDRNDIWKKRWERIHPGDREKWRTTIEKAFKEKSDWEIEGRLVLLDGSIKYVHAKAHPVVGPSGDVEQFIGSITDITERKRAEEIIRRQEMELRQVLDFSPLLVAVFGPDRERLYANRPTLDYFGVTLEEWRNISDPLCFYHPDDRERIARDAYTGDQVPHEFEARLRKSDGSYRWFLFRDNPVRDEEGRITRWYFSATDIEDRKRAEEKLRQSEEELRQLVDVIPQQVFVFDANWSPIFANRRELEYTGLTSQEMQSKDAVARIFHPEDLKKLEVARERARSDGAPFEMEARIRGKDGRYRWFLIRDNPLRDEQGRVLRWYGTRTDIEDRKRAEEARSKAQADLAHLDRVNVLGELTASISHELKQPIAAAMTNAQTSLRWLNRKYPDLQEAREALARIVQDGARATGIIDRLRSLYKKEPAKRGPLAVNAVIGEMVELLRGQATRHAVSLRANLSTDLPIVIADRVQVQQVLMNLMLNGIEAMSDTGGVLTVRSQLREDGQIEISINDTGPGLPSGKADQVFDAFFTTKPQGSGMGLAISKSIVESHGGQIWASATGGHGATFHFTLPAAPSEASLPVDMA
jgi:PAS domain S-box-containing protein